MLRVHLTGAAALAALMADPPVHPVAPGEPALRVPLADPGHVVAWNAGTAGTDAAIPNTVASRLET